MRGKVHTLSLLFLAALLCALPLSNALAQQAGNPLDVLPKPAQAATGATPKVEPPPQQAQDVLAQTLIPRQFDIVGVKSVPFDEVAKVFVPLAGQTVTVGRIVEVAGQITQLYRNAGFALSFAFVPPQDFQNGVVKVTIVEGYMSGSVRLSSPP